jgi:hypothetical protein
MAIQSVRPIIGAQHPLGHDLIDGGHVVLAEVVAAHGQIRGSSEGREKSISKSPTTAMPAP